MLAPWKKSNDKLRKHIKKQRYYFANKGPSSQSYGFSIVMYGCESWNHKEGWLLKNWCFQMVVLEKTLESPLDCKEIKPVNPKENQCWILIGRTDVEAETATLWPPDAKSWLIGKDPDAEKDWGQKKKGVTEDEMSATDSMDISLSKLWEVAMQHTQGSLVCCSPQGHKELNNNSVDLCLSRPPDLPLEKPVCRSGSNS